MHGLTDLPALAVRKIGRRGLFLVLLAVLWCTTAFNVYITAPDIVISDALIYQQLPVPMRIAAWVASAAFMAFAALRRSRWQPAGFAVAAIMPVERVIGGLWSAFASVAPGGADGNLQSIVPAMTWAVIVGIIWLVAGWDEDLFPRAEE